MRTMADNPIRIINLLISELELTSDQALIFLYTIRNRKSTISQMCMELGIEENTILLAVNNLVDNGMLFSLDNMVFETFHPRFSIVNCHRIRCERLGISWGKNAKIDALGALLEGYHESARTK